MCGKNVRNKDKKTTIKVVIHSIKSEKLLFCMFIRPLALRFINSFKMQNQTQSDSWVLTFIKIMPTSNISFFPGINPSFLIFVCKIFTIRSDLPLLLLFFKKIKRIDGSLQWKYKQRYEFIRYTENLGNSCIVEDINNGQVKRIG